MYAGINNFARLEKLAKQMRLLTDILLVQQIFDLYHIQNKFIIILKIEVIFGYLSEH